MSEDAPSDERPTGRRSGALRDALGRTTWSERLLLLGTLGVLVGASTSRLTAVHGVEAALTFGVVLPPLFAAAAASRPAEGGGAARLRKAGAQASIVFIAALALLALNHLRIRQCTPVEGLLFMLLGPGVGCALAVSVGALVAAMMGQRRLTPWVAGFVPLAALGAGVWRFWSTPAIRVYGIFGGWFPGTIYDEAIAMPTAFLTHRLLAGTLFAAASVLVVVGVDADGRLRWATLRRAPFAAGLVVVLLSGNLVAYAAGPSLGHRTSVAHIDEVLGRVSTGDRCVIHAPREMASVDVARLLEDCEFGVAEAEARIGVRESRRIHAFFYRSAAEKEALMGAGNTYIAKPWRAEVHLQVAGWPHPVLAHELVHAVAAQASRGPFRVSGRFGGLLPNPGFIEGIAVAVAWREHDGLDPDHWSRAMLELEALPPVRDFMGLRFTRYPPRMAYAAAGSFVRFLMQHDEVGVAGVRRAHRLGRLAGAVATDVDDLERQWHDHLRAVESPEGASEIVRMRLTRGSIFAATCPHRAATLRAQLQGDMGASDWDAASRTCDALLSIDARDSMTRTVQVGVLARQGETARAAEVFDALEEEGAPAPLLAHALTQTGDAHYLAGRTDEARDAYDRVMALPQTHAAARNLEVRRIATDHDEPAASLIGALLIGQPERRAGTATLVHLAREIDAARPDGLGAYLEARQLINEGQYARARARLDRAIERGLPTARLRREAARMMSLLLYAVGDEAALEAHLASDTMTGPTQAWNRDYWTRRLRWRRAR